MHISGTMTRRILVAGGGMSLGALLIGRASGMRAQEATPSPESGAAEDGPVLDRAEIKRLRDADSHVCRATSPACVAGDVYTLSIRNASTTATAFHVVTTVMDHIAHVNQPVVEEVILAAGASRTLAATNAYGTANHFQTTLFTNTGEATALEIEVVVVDAAGEETARFTHGAFMVNDLDELAALRRENRRRGHKRRRERHQHREHQHDDGGETEASERDPELTLTR
jgi:hypothetical protein